MPEPLPIHAAYYGSDSERGITEEATASGDPGDSFKIVYRGQRGISTVFGLSKASAAP